MNVTGKPFIQLAGSLCSNPLLTLFYFSTVPEDLLNKKDPKKQIKKNSSQMVMLFTCSFKQFNFSFLLLLLDANRGQSTIMQNYNLSFPLMQLSGHT